MTTEADLILPDWPAPARVKALQTTRQGGNSTGTYASLNLGMHVGDQPLHVAQNRQQLSQFVPTEPLWLSQVHGAGVVDASTAACQPKADAAYARIANTVCAVMTADCLPVLLCDTAGTVVAAAHAGWRGLLDGVLEATVHSMQVPPQALMAWLGPAIGPQTFEVGGEVRDAFLARDAAAEAAFSAAHNEKWLADIYLLARQRLHGCGVTAVHGGGYCTYSDSNLFFSYRRDGVTGRMATMIWLEQAA